MGIFQKLIFLVFIVLSLNQSFAQDLPTDYKVENDAQFEQAFRFLGKKFGKKYDSLGYTQYRELHVKTVDWILKNDFPQKMETIRKLYRISSIQKDNFSQMSILEYFVQVPESISAEELYHYLFQLGTLNIIYENYPKALYFLNKFVQLDKLKSPAVREKKYWSSYKELGYVYYKLGNYHEAIKCYRLFYQGVKDKSFYFEPSALNDIGQCYRELKMKDSAVFYFKKSVERINEYHKLSTTDKNYIHYFKPIVEASMFDYYIEEKRYKEAILLGQREINGAKLVNDLGAISRGYYKIMVGHYYLNHYNEVLTYFNMFEQTLKIKPNTRLYLNALRYKLKTDISLGKIQDSKLDIAKMETIDSILKYKSIEESKELVLKTNLQIKEEEIKTINEQIGLGKKIDRYKNIVIALVSLFFLASFGFYYKTRKSNTQIQIQHEIIQNEYDKQKVLIREVHHRVKNNLQLISSFLQIQVGKTKDVKGREVLDESINNINAIALIHENLYKKENIGNVQLIEYLQSLTQSIKNTFQNNHGLEINVVCDPILISIDKTISIGLIVNELITNSIKHGFESNIGHIRIDIQEQVDMILLYYQDNGRGILTTDLVNENSLGLKLVKMLIDDIGGIYELILGKGFHLKIKFPL